MRFFLLASQTCPLHLLCPGPMTSENSDASQCLTSQRVWLKSVMPMPPGDCHHHGSHSSCRSQGCWFWTQIPDLHLLGPLGPLTETPEAQMGPSEVVRNSLGAVWTILLTGLGLAPDSLGIPGLQGLQLGSRKPQALHGEPHRVKQQQNFTQGHSWDQSTGLACFLGLPRPSSILTPLVVAEPDPSKPWPQSPHPAKGPRQCPWRGLCTGSCVSKSLRKGADA